MRLRLAAVGYLTLQLIRILSAQPKPDADGFVITAAFHRDEWYEVAYGQNPVPFYRNPYTGAPNRPPYPWRPGAVAWAASDTVFPNRLSFDLTVNESVSPTSLDIGGWAPVNALPAPPVVNGPQVPLQATTSNTGGSIKPGVYLIAFSGGVAGPVSNFVTAVVPSGTNTNTITVSGIIWGNNTNQVITPYVGEDSLHMRRAGISTYTSTSADANGNHTSFSFLGISVDGSGMPDVVFSSMLLEAYDLIHGGVWGDAIGSVSVGGSILTFPNAAFTINQWAGYTMTLYYEKAIGPQIPINVSVLSNTATTVSLAGIPGWVAGNVVVMRPQSTGITANTIGDANFVNSYGPSGLTANAEIGNLLWIIAGTGAGMPPYTIASNTATAFTISGQWYITPDSTSVYIVTSPHPRYSIQTGTIANDGSFNGQLVGSISTANFAGGSLWVGAISLDNAGNPSPERYAPFREVWVPLR